MDDKIYTTDQSTGAEKMTRFLYLSYVNILDFCSRFLKIIKQKNQIAKQPVSSRRMGIGFTLLLLLNNSVHANTFYPLETIATIY